MTGADDTLPAGAVAFNALDVVQRGRINSWSGAGAWCAGFEAAQVATPTAPDPDTLAQILADTLRIGPIDAYIPWAHALLADDRLTITTRAAADVADGRNPR